ncbi:MAG: hypothetical protein J6J58_01855 [Oscillospiraceae bacterium]|nr:hypothetical protein [Oscillospiraceae bacterium]
MKQFCRKLLALIIFIDGMTILSTAVLYVIASLVKVNFGNIWVTGFKVAVIAIFLILITKYLDNKNK